MKDLFAAVCLVAVLEGLFLFVAPFAWKRMAERLLDLPSPALRSFGGLVLLAGLSLLWWARHYRAGPERPARPGGAADRPVKPSVGKVAPDPGNPDNAQKPDGPPRSAFSVSGPSIAGAPRLEPPSRCWPAPPRFTRPRPRWPQHMRSPSWVSLS
ncbi:DUF2065 domain-containing protein [Stenotrophomonas sp. PSU_St99]